MPHVDGGHPPTAWQSDPAQPAPKPPAPLGAKLLFWGGVGLMVLASLAMVGDWAARNYEMTRLLAAIEASEAQMSAAQDEINSVEFSPSPSAEELARARDELSAAAAAGRDGVRAAGEQVGLVSFLPWHGDMVSAQGAYLAHNGAWVDYLSAGADDPQTMFDGEDAIEPTWRHAEFQVREAVPPLPWPGISGRVDRIFTDQEPEGQDPGSTVDV
jgi:hypothetical protein